MFLRFGSVLLRVGSVEDPEDQDTCAPEQHTEDTEPKGRTTTKRIKKKKILFKPNYISFERIEGNLH